LSNMVSRRHKRLLASLRPMSPLRYPLEPIYDPFSEMRSEGFRAGVASSPASIIDPKHD